MALLSMDGSHAMADGTQEPETALKRGTHAFMRVSLTETLTP